MTKKHIQNTITIIAILFIITGFGIIHSPKQVVEYIGSGLLGVGTLYFLYLLIITRKKDN